MAFETLRNPNRRLGNHPRNCSTTVIYLLFFMYLIFLFYTYYNSKINICMLNRNQPWRKICYFSIFNEKLLIQCQDCFFFFFRKLEHMSVHVILLTHHQTWIKAGFVNPNVQFKTDTCGKWRISFYLCHHSRVKHPTNRPSFNFKLVMCVCITIDNL